MSENEKTTKKGKLSDASTCSMIWVTTHSTNRDNLLYKFGNEALLPSPVKGGWTFKTKPEIEMDDLPFTSPDDPQLEQLQFISNAQAQP